MNRVTLIGRATKDPSISYAQNGGMTIARYTLAVDRRGKDQQADFISCVAFGKSAEFAEKYLKKGTKIAVNGRIQTGSYKNKDGQTVYTTDVVIEDHEFVESKKQEPANDTFQMGVINEGFEMPDNVEDAGLPFN